MKELLTPKALLTNLKDVRALTRNVIEAFPEKDLFEFSIANLRPFSQMVEEFLMITNYIFTETLHEKHTPFYTEGQFPTTKAEVLALWDRATEILDREWQKVGDYTQPLTIYQMTFSFAQWILYFIENESHHRGQGYTYLRALGIQPPSFWGRESFNS
ncbi:DinB family protein [Capnocytophaga sputigena]|uniref:DinB family protein n=1 Tax=Capnocytophaga sputigena TaxID=1019 RepID=UPI0028D092C0|nr:DinB family protein [Capnocytophaga sputigena]